MKQIIVNGCSFTNGNFDLPRGSYTWANVVRDHYLKSNISFTNLGYKGNANETILKKTLSHLKAINPNDEIILLVQLSAIDRIVVDGERSPTIGSFLKSLNWMKWGMSKNEPTNNKWKDYFLNEYTEENHIGKFLDLLINFQSVLKSYKNVNYKIFCGWDILTQNTNNFNMWDLKIKYQNINDNLVTSLYKSTSEKFRELDLQKFWFFKNNFIHYGGLSQWVQYNVPVEQWYRDVNKKEIDYHPSDFAHKCFADKVIIPLIETML
tara:strand:+ start:22 stop:816 length:795 start_codon:yes stop_codon:yes gene_type:complete